MPRDWAVPGRTRLLGWVTNLWGHRTPLGAPQCSLSSYMAHSLEKSLATSPFIALFHTPVTCGGGHPGDSQVSCPPRQWVSLVMLPGAQPGSIPAPMHWGGNIASGAWVGTMNMLWCPLKGPQRHWPSESPANVLLTKPCINETLFIWCYIWICIPILTPYTIVFRPTIVYQGKYYNIFWPDSIRNAFWNHAWLFLDSWGEKKSQWLCVMEWLLCFFYSSLSW